MDRTGWTPWQNAWAEHSTLESKLHDLRQDLNYAHAAIRNYTTADGEYQNPQWIREHQEQAETLPARIAEVEQQLTVAADNLAKATMLNRDRAVQLVGELTGRHVNPDTWSGYVSRGQAPKPDSRDGGSPLWSEWTVRQWAAQTPRPGTRRDLQDGKSTVEA